MSIGVPIKVLHEAEGHIVTCETNTGEVYRGKLIEAEDNMNCQVRSKHLHCVAQYICCIILPRLTHTKLSHPFILFMGASHQVTSDGMLCLTKME